MNPWKMSTFALATGLAFTLLSAEVPSAEAETQPHMRAALASLRSAKNQLEKATTDKGGHRAKAMQLTKEAIEQVEKGIAHDNEHATSEAPAIE